MRKSGIASSTAAAGLLRPPSRHVVELHHLPRRLDRKLIQPMQSVKPSSEMLIFRRKSASVWREGRRTMLVVVRCVRNDLRRVGLAQVRVLPRERRKRWKSKKGTNSARKGCGSAGVVRGGRWRAAGHSVEVSVVSERDEREVEVSRESKPASEKRAVSPSLSLTACFSYNQQTKSGAVLPLPSHHSRASELPPTTSTSPAKSSSPTRSRSQAHSRFSVQRVRITLRPRRNLSGLASSNDPSLRFQQVPRYALSSAPFRTLWRKRFADRVRIVQLHPTPNSSSSLGAETFTRFVFLSPLRSPPSPVDRSPALVHYSLHNPTDTTVGPQ